MSRFLIGQTAMWALLIMQIDLTVVQSDNMWHVITVGLYLAIWVSECYIFVLSQIQIDVLDVNDNAPKFERDAYSAVTPENVAIGWSVIKVVAKDPDESLSGEVEFEIADEGDAQGTNK